MLGNQPQPRSLKQFNPRRKSESREDFRQGKARSLSEQDALHGELKELIIETLALEDITAAEIEDRCRALCRGDWASIPSIRWSSRWFLEERYGVYPRR